MKLGFRISYFEFASVGVCVLVSAVCGGYAGEPTLAEARSRWLHGNYQEAEAIYRTLANTTKEHIAAVIGISHCLQSQGEYDRARELIETSVRADSQNADLLARYAELLYLRGRWDEADQFVAKALALRPDHFLARWIRSQVYRDRGDWTKADAELRWFVRTYTEKSGRNDEIKEPEQLLLVGLAGAENARWHKMADQFRVVLNDVFGDAIKNDKDFWPAEYYAGMLLLEKYNHGQALQAFDKALSINPNAAEVLAGKGAAALQKYEIRDAELFASRALKINSQLPEARRLMADIHLLAGDLKAAKHESDAARRVNPRDEMTLGRWAACLQLSRDQDAFNAVVKEILERNSRPGVFYYTLAEALEERKRYEAAEEYYRKAMELQPWLPWPQNSLGLLYMRLGREKEARDILSKATEADEFNVRVFNSLRVLRHLEKYATVRTEHFELRFDPHNDERLALYMQPYLEDIYRRLAEKFQYKPPERILIEIFNEHEMFSGRVIALPDLHTIGASTGRIIAMTSPNARGLRRPFNWARVLRHELVHVFNLEQTKFQAPHWLTEGLAVIEEGFPRPQQWNDLLAERVPTGEVMTLENIDLAFIRPRSPLDWQMAYCQSQLYVEYIIKQYGPQSTGEMLRAYGDGLDTSATISKVCHVDRAAFENGYREYMKTIADCGLPIADLQSGLRIAGPASSASVEKRLTYRQLQKAYDSNREDPGLAARMAEQLLIRGDKKEARRLAEDVLAKDRSHQLASYVKARLLLDAGDDDQARALLEGALNGPKQDPKVLQALAKLYYESRDFAKAADLYERAHKTQPAETKWLTGLLRCYSQTGEKAKRIEVLEKLVLMDADELDMRKQLAQSLSETGQHGQAERYAREALEIDVRDAGAWESLLKSLVAQHKEPEAAKARELLAK
jgi:tetratricopeptide (TPR) repeat protein